MIPDNFKPSIPNKGGGQVFTSPDCLTQIRIMHPSEGEFLRPNGYIRKMINGKSYVDFNDNIPNSAIYSKDKSER